MALEPDTLDGDCDCEEGAPAWMATFSDLATLLLTFFVLLLSFAEMDVVEFKEMLGSVRDAFGVQYEVKGHLEALSTTPVELNDVESIPFSPLNQKQIGALRAVERFIRQRHLEGDLEVGMSDNGVVVRLKDRLAFSVGDAKLKGEAEPVMQQVVEMMKAFPSSMSIEGHTDDIPIKNGRYENNWELSSARAIAVLKYIESLGPLPTRNVSVVGHADMQPVVPNDTTEHRAQNRRVEFVFNLASTGKAEAAVDKVKEAGFDATIAGNKKGIDAAANSVDEVKGEPEPTIEEPKTGEAERPFVEPLRPIGGLE